MDGTAKSDQTIIGGIVRATLALCMVLTVPAVATSQPKFSDSTITTVPRVVAEGDVVTFHVAVRNTGNEDAPFTEMTLGLPLEPLFVDLSGLDNAKVDRAAKSVTAVFDLSVGETDEFAVRMVVPRDAGGNTLVPDLALRFPHRGVEFRGGEPIMIETAVSGRGLSIGGGVRIAPAGLAVVAVLVLYPALWMTLPRRRRRHSAIFMIVLATAFLTMFAGLAYRDWQTLGVWLETSCTILDKRMRVDTQASSIRSRAGGRRAEVLSLQQLLV